MRMPFSAANATSRSPASKLKRPGCGSIASHFISFSGVSESNSRATSALTFAFERRVLISAVPIRLCAAAPAWRSGFSVRGGELVAAHELPTPRPRRCRG